MFPSKRSSSLLLICAMLLVLHTTASPFSPASILDNESIAASDSRLPKRSLANGTTLRILPLGASITYGYLSTDGNGYRESLRDQLVCTGNDVNMIGSRSNGTMADNQVEGWPGYVISAVALKANLSLPSLPNIVLINAGTNDAVQNLSISTAGDRMGNLVEHILAVVPDVVVVVSTVLPNANLVFEDRINGTINPSYRDMVESLQDQGQKVELAEMHDGYITKADLHSDGTHPLDEGYVKMADVWFNALLGVDAKGWITAPHEVNGVDDEDEENICGEETEAEEEEESRN